MRLKPGIYYLPSISWISIISCRSNLIWRLTYDNPVRQQMTMLAYSYWVSCHKTSLSLSQVILHQKIYHLGIRRWPSVDCKVTGDKKIVPKHSNHLSAVWRWTLSKLQPHLCMMCCVVIGYRNITMPLTYILSLSQVFDVNWLIWRSDDFMRLLFHVYRHDHWILSHNLIRHWYC